MNKLVIDADGLVLGRLAAYCAKKALLGREVDVINVEKAVISGNPNRVVAVYKKRRQMTNAANPEHAAKWPRRPDMLFKRVVKGMLPFGARKRAALKRIKAFIGNNNATGVQPVKGVSKLGHKFVSLAELSRQLGWAQHV